MAEVTLLRYPTSPFTRRIELGLGLKGIPYECVDIDPSSKDELYNKHNPIYRKVPILLHQGHSIPESLIILHYLDDAFPDRPPLLPSDPYDRAHARFYAHFIDDKFLPVLRTAFWVDGEPGEAAVKTAKEYLTILEKELGGKKFFGGDSIGYLDIVATYVALWIPSVQQVVGRDIFNGEEHPVLWKWSENLLGSEAGKKYLLEKQVLVDFFEGKKEGIRAFFNKPAN